MIAELERLEHTFRDIPEVAFIGCHSAKFDQEEALYMLRSAVRRYDVKHAVVNDCHFDIWNSQKLNNWPTVMIVAPDGSIIFKTTEEGNEEILQHKLLAAIDDHLERQHAIRDRQRKGENCADIFGDLSSTPLPLKLEKNKPKDKKDLSEEAVIAIR